MALADLVVNFSGCRPISDAEAARLVVLEECRDASGLLLQRVATATDEEFACSREIVAALQRENRLVLALRGLRAAAENVEMQTTRRKRRRPLVDNAIKRRRRRARGVAKSDLARMPVGMLSAPASEPESSRKDELQERLDRIERGITELQELADQTETAIVRDAKRRRRAGFERKLQARS